MRRGKLFFLFKLPHFQGGKLQTSMRAGRERGREQEELSTIWELAVYSKTRRLLRKAETVIKGNSGIPALGLTINVGYQEL